MNIGSRIKLLRLVTLAATFQALVAATYVDPSVLDACPGYSAKNVKIQRKGLTADLVLGEKPCNIFDADISKLSLSVVYETSDRIHLKIVDPSTARYEVPESILPRPSSASSVAPHSAAIQFNYTASPFSFSIFRTSTHEVLFTTTGHPLIFEPQYLRVKTSIPTNANIYGLGEHTNPFHLPTDNLTLTLWSRDAYGVPNGTNLYSNHPIYFDHRTTGTHGVFFLSSDGMDVKLTNTDPGGPALEYNVIGGVLDFYFLAGSETDPTAVAKQYAEVVGMPAEVPYWSFGLHQCRFGYQKHVLTSTFSISAPTYPFPSAVSLRADPEQCIFSMVSISLAPRLSARRRLFNITLNARRFSALRGYLGATDPVLSKSTGILNQDRNPGSQTRSS